MQLNQADKFMWEIWVSRNSSKNAHARFLVRAQTKAQVPNLLKQKPFYLEWLEKNPGAVIGLVKRHSALGSRLEEGLIET